MKSAKARTSITINSQVYETAKNLAAADNKSFSALVEEALEALMHIVSEPVDMHDGDTYDEVANG